MASTFEDVPMSDDMDFEDDVEAELEVDELDPSDDEQQPAAAPQPPSPSKKSQSTTKPGQRVPGHTLLPAARVENILQANGITSALGMSKEGQFMLSIATEEFIKKLAKYAYDEAQHEKSNMVRYEDIALVPAAYQPEFSFLQEIIPRPMALKYAMEFRERKLQDLQDEDPALGGFIPAPYYTSAPNFPPTASASASTSTSTTTTAKPKKQKSSTNGKEKQTNGSSESASGKQKKADKSASAKSSRSASASSTSASVKQEPGTKSRPSRKSANGLNASHLSAKPEHPSPLANGHVKSESPDPNAMETSAGVS